MGARINETASFRPASLSASRRRKLPLYPAATGPNPFMLAPLLPLWAVEARGGEYGSCPRGEGAFTEEDLALSRQASNQIALAVDNALAYGEISHAKTPLAERTLSGILNPQ